MSPIYAIGLTNSELMSESMTNESSFEHAVMSKRQHTISEKFFITLILIIDLNNYFGKCFDLFIVIKNDVKKSYSYRFSDAAPYIVWSMDTSRDFVSLVKFGYKIIKIFYNDQYIL